MPAESGWKALESIWFRRVQDQLTKGAEVSVDERHARKRAMERRRIWTRAAFFLPADSAHKIVQTLVSPRLGCRARLLHTLREKAVTDELQAQTSFSARSIRDMPHMEADLARTSSADAICFKVLGAREPASERSYNAALVVQTVATTHYHLVAPIFVVSAVHCSV